MKGDTIRRLPSVIVNVRARAAASVPAQVAMMKGSGDGRRSALTREVAIGSRSVQAELKIDGSIPVTVFRRRGVRARRADIRQFISGCRASERRRQHRPRSAQSTVESGFISDVGRGGTAGLQPAVGAACRNRVGQLRPGRRAVGDVLGTPSGTVRRSADAAELSSAPSIQSPGSRRPVGRRRPRSTH